MTGNSEPAQDGADTFRVVLTPHRSLGPKGFLALMLAFGAISFATGIVFYIAGAWPVVGFLGLDVLLVYVAFRLNYRSGRRNAAFHFALLAEIRPNTADKKSQRSQSRT